MKARAIVAAVSVAASVCVGATEEERTIFEDDLLGVVSVQDEPVAGGGDRTTVAIEVSLESDGGEVVTLHVPRPLQQVAEGRLMQRTTRRVATKPGGVNALSAGLSAINVVNPMAWIMHPTLAGETPAESLQHEFYEQITQTRFRYMDGRARQTADVYLSVAIEGKTLDMPLVVDDDGLAIVKLRGTT